ncbi:unnamed protein product [Mytilus coruscus]|uniref:Uncharacterized protein n=1 Tax=Mytilus coruscus TaxID=42192 RepID=A0A6J7ZZH1_MYTCO|nr:unnamed protein product [Mytilus coruscus]
MGSLIKRIEDQVINFYHDNSRLTAVGNTSFCRLRPLWVVPSRDSDRDTCACKLHENIQFIVNTLIRVKVLETHSLKEIVNLSVCNSEDLDCMYGRCQKCSKKEMIDRNSGNYDKKEEVTWFQWITKKEKRIVKTEEKDITLTVKDEMKGALGLLVDRFSEEMEMFRIHYFNIDNQLKYFRQLKENLQQNETLIHVDFSENFVCKLGYGENAYSFSSVSDSFEHGLCAIWTFLNPLLDEIQIKYPDIHTLHFFSDGPSTQYKQKGNFFLQNSWQKEDIHLPAATSMKVAMEKALLMVLMVHLRELQGEDIIDTASFVKSFNGKDSNVALFEVSRKEVEKNSTILSNLNLKTVPCTLKMQQLFTTAFGEIEYRDISCFCRKDGQHSGHE